VTSHYKILHIFTDHFSKNHNRLACWFNTRCFLEPEWLSRYSDWLRAGRPRGRSSSPGRVKNFHFSISSRPALGPTQPPIQWVPGAVSPGVKRQRREAEHSPLCVFCFPIQIRSSTWLNNFRAPLNRHPYRINHHQLHGVSFFRPVSVSKYV
jgi:hypothetical protein